MFPLTPVPPTCTEAWIVCIADKICAIEGHYLKDELEFLAFYSDLNTKITI